jgi:hypothetical protein
MLFPWKRHANIKTNTALLRLIMCRQVHSSSIARWFLTLLLNSYNAQFSESKHSTRVIQNVSAPCVILRKLHGAELLLRILVVAELFKFPNFYRTRSHSNEFTCVPHQQCAYPEKERERLTKMLMLSSSCLQPSNFFHMFCINTINVYIKVEYFFVSSPFTKPTLVIDKFPH